MNQMLKSIIVICALSLCACRSNPIMNHYHVDTTYAVWVKNFPTSMAYKSIVFGINSEGHNYHFGGLTHGDHASDNSLPDFSGKTVEVYIGTRDARPNETVVSASIRTNVKVPQCEKRGEVMQYFRIFAPDRIEVEFLTIDEWKNKPREYEKISD
jgi:hypothetical protein